MQCEYSSSVKTPTAATAGAPSINQPPTCSIRPPPSPLNRSSRAASAGRKRPGTAAMAENTRSAASATASDCHMCAQQSMVSFKGMLTPSIFSKQQRQPRPSTAAWAQNACGCNTCRKVIMGTMPQLLDVCNAPALSCGHITTTPPFPGTGNPSQAKPTTSVTTNLSKLTNHRVLQQRHYRRR